MGTMVVTIGSSDIWPRKHVDYFGWLATAAATIVGKGQGKTMPIAPSDGTTYVSVTCPMSHRIPTSLCPLLLAASSSSTIVYNYLQLHSRHRAV
jgi:hypothetical protein